MSLTSHNKMIACTCMTAALLVAYAALCAPRAGAEPVSVHEYDVKAVFIFQFITFVEGFRFDQKADTDDQTGQHDDKPITIGIIGKDPFQNAFEPLIDRRIRDRQIAVRHFQGLSDLNREGKKVTVHPDMDQIKTCDVVFVCSSEQTYADQILGPIRDERILAIADVPGFLEKGGIINFMTENYKVRFEISVVAAERAKLTIRSKLLRLAKRVVEQGDLENK